MRNNTAGLLLYNCAVVKLSIVHDAVAAKHTHTQILSIESLWSLISVMIKTTMSYLSSLFEAY